MDFENPEADAAEQSRQAEFGTEDEQDAADLPEPRMDADPADVADQRRIVPGDDSDERD